MWYWVCSRFVLPSTHLRKALTLTGDIDVLTMVCTFRAALCQVYDSIFMDVPMSRVKFNVNTEYAYIQNFKVLQSMSPLSPRPTTLPVAYF